MSDWADAAEWALNPLSKVAARPEAKGAFEAGDFALNHGGQVVLDAANLVPGAGEVVSGVQAEYHTMHAANDFARGDTKAGLAQSTEAGWNAVNMIPGAHEALTGVHVAELTADSMLTLGNYATGANAPMSAAIVSEGAAELAEKQAKPFVGQYD